MLILKIHIDFLGLGTDPNRRDSVLNNMERLLLRDAFAAGNWSHMTTSISFMCERAVV